MIAVPVMGDHHDHQQHARSNLLNLSVGFCCLGGLVERLFAERGPPLSIRSDNGVPFASPNALFGLSKPSVWWWRLGIAIERIKPGQPQQNGRHERMHLTLKRKPPVTYVSGLDNFFIGAGEGIRTLDPNLGKVVLYP